MYIIPEGTQLEQGDIFDGCPLPVLLDTEPTPGGTTLTVPTGRVVVLTQTCDFAQGKAARAVVALCHTAHGLVDRGILKPAAIRDQIRLGKMYGWYYLPNSGEPIGLPESVIDLRDLHTIPVLILMGLLAAGKRRCRLLTPYREHLAQHFAITYMRIALPEPYETQP